MYKAVTEYRLDWRIDRPSWEPMVFWRDMGMNDDDDEVEAREGLCSIVATDMSLDWSPRREVGGRGQREVRWLRLSKANPPSERRRLHTRPIRKVTAEFAGWAWVTRANCQGLVTLMQSDPGKTGCDVQMDAIERRKRGWMMLDVAGR